MHNVLKGYLQGIMGEGRSKLEKTPGRVWQTNAGKVKSGRSTKPQWAAVHASATDKNGPKVERGFPDEKSARAWSLGGGVGSQTWKNREKAVIAIPHEKQVRGTQQNPDGSLTPKSAGDDSGLKKITNTQPVGAEKEPADKKPVGEPTQNPSRESNPLHQYLEGSEIDVKGLLASIKGVASRWVGDKGAGQVNSQAGEAATVLVTESLRLARTKDYDTSIEEFFKKNTEQIDALLTELKNSPKSKLDSSWADAARKQALSIFYTIEGKKYNSKVKKIAWDTESGRKSMGLPMKHPEDSSDMFVQTEDGRLVGISLKKDGNVMLANKGLQKLLSTIAIDTDPSTKQQLHNIGISHTHSIRMELAHLRRVVASEENRDTLVKTLSGLSRKYISKLKSEKYDGYFDRKGDHGKLTPEAIQTIINPETEKKTSNTTLDTKLFLKVMKTAGPLSGIHTIKETLNNMRDEDSHSTQKLLSLMQTNSNVLSAATKYLIDALKVDNLITTHKPFGDDYPVDSFFMAYGLAAMNDKGNNTGLVVTGKTVIDTFNLSEDMSYDELKSSINKRFVVDKNDSGDLGFLRLRITNTNPPPDFFYPTIATLQVRSRGVGMPPTIDIRQHSAWTYSLQNHSPNPNDWTEPQRTAQIKDTVGFLNRQIHNELLTDEQKIQISKERTYYASLIK